MYSLNGTGTATPLFEFSKRATFLVRYGGGGLNRQIYLAAAGSSDGWSPNGEESGT